MTWNRESKKHIDLKNQARELLKAEGCVKIIEEFHICAPEGIKIDCMSGMVVDLYAEKKGKKTFVECGHMAYPVHRMGTIFSQKDFSEFIWFKYDGSIKRYSAKLLGTILKSKLLNRTSNYLIDGEIK